MSTPEPNRHTAQDALDLQAIACNEAEKVINTGENMAYVHAAAAVANAWGSLARNLLDQERATVLELAPAEWPTLHGPIDSPTAVGPPFEGWVPAPQPGAIPAWTEPVPGDADHQHDGGCRHAWIQGMEPCRGCGASPNPSRAKTEYCPKSCPNPGPVGYITSHGFEPRDTWGPAEPGSTRR